MKLCLVNHPAPFIGMSDTSKHRTCFIFCAYNANITLLDLDFEFQWFSGVTRTLVECSSFFKNPVHFLHGGPDFEQ